MARWQYSGQGNVGNSQGAPERDLAIEIKLKDSIATISSLFSPHSTPLFFETIVAISGT